MLTPVTATTPAEARPLTAFAEDSAPGGLFSEPVDVALLEQLELDEFGRRCRWLPADVLL